MKIIAKPVNLKCECAVRGGGGGACSLTFTYTFTTIQNSHEEESHGMQKCSPVKSMPNNDVATKFESDNRLHKQDLYPCAFKQIQTITELLQHINYFIISTYINSLFQHHLQSLFHSTPTIITTNQPTGNNNKHNVSFCFFDEFVFISTRQTTTQTKYIN